jgi:hypothetical protein
MYVCMYACENLCRIRPLEYHQWHAAAERPSGPSRHCVNVLGHRDSSFTPKDHIGQPCYLLVETVRCDTSGNVLFCTV